MTNLQRMDMSHIAAAQALSAAQGWPHSRDDWSFLLSHGAGWVTTAGDGTVTGTTLFWRQGRVATIGMVIVDQSHRGQGLGRTLMNAALADLGGMTCRLYATADGRPLYDRLGFEPIGMVAQCQGVPDGTPALPDVPPVTPLDEPHWDDAAALDRQACGWDRGAVLRALFSQGDLWGIRDGDHVRAYALSRLSGRGRIIGPIVSPDRDTAKALIQTAIQSDPVAHTRLDTNPDLGLTAWLDSLALHEVSQSAVMSRGPEIPQSADGVDVFGLASQALG